MKIGSVTVAPGQRTVVHLPVTQIYSHDSPLSLPVHIVRGKKDGPVMFVSAVVHGDELNGVEIVRRVLAHRSLKRMSGSLLAVPVVNGFGMLHQSRYLPDRRDLNRSFPGSEKGSLAARLANIFLEQIVGKSQYGIDLHTAASHRDNLPQIRANLDDPQTRELATSFGVPVVINAAERDGSLRESASEKGVKTLLYEAGEALRFSELGIRIGVLGILRVMRFIGMLPPARSNTKGPNNPFIARSSSWIRASSTGVVTLQAKLGEVIAANEVVARIYDPYDYFDNGVVEIRAPHAGLIIGLTKNPLVYEGDALMHVARFSEPSDVASEVEMLRDHLLQDP